jgi:hypothetical protein
MIAKGIVATIVWIMLMDTGSSMVQMSPELIFTGFVGEGISRAVAGVAILFLMIVAFAWFADPVERKRMYPANLTLLVGGIVGTMYPLLPGLA